MTDPAGNRKAPVDIARLGELGDGTRAGTAEMVTLYLSETDSALARLAAAAARGDRLATRRLAHTAAGASALCGAVALSERLEEIEALAESGPIEALTGATRSVIVEFDAVRAYLRGAFLG